MSPRAPLAALLALQLLLTLLTSPAPAAAKFVCPAKRKLVHAVPCKAIRLPKQLCTSCRMRKFGPGGTFKNPRDIYDLSTPACRDGIRRYVNLNPCDWKRKEQLNKFFIKKNRNMLADFMYSVCEQCCDCVPWDSRPGTYEKQKRENKLIQIQRGNCPAHAWYDVCMYFPDIRDIKPETGRLMPWRPPVCPELCKWLFSNQSKGWLKNRFIPNLNWKIKRMLRQLTWHARCRKKIVWQECTRMELAQGRV